MDVVRIFDTTLRDGEQSPGFSMKTEEKIRLARQLGPGHTIVTVLCDGGNRYQSKLFNPDFMRSKKLPVPEWLERKTDVTVPFEKA